MTRTHYKGMEDQLSALGSVLNCAVLWNSVHTNRALEQIRAQGHPVRDEDVQRLSAFIRTHIGIEGRCAFHLPDLGGTHRTLRNPDARDDERAGVAQWLRPHWSPRFRSYPSCARNNVRRSSPLLHPRSDPRVSRSNRRRRTSSPTSCSRSRHAARRVGRGGGIHSVTDPTGPPVAPLSRTTIR